jgi:transposase
MKPPLLIRSLTDDERLQLETDRRPADAFRVRRAQIVLASARGRSPKPIAELVGCAVQTVRHVIHAFNAQGVKGLVQHSNRPKTVKPSLDVARGDRLQPILHQSPRTSGQSTGVWTLALAAAVCDEHGVTERLMSDATIRRARNRLGTTWKRATHWLTSPDPQYARKKRGAIPDGARVGASGLGRGMLG